MISYLANPERFMRISRPVAIGCGALAAGLIGWAMYAAFFVAPPEADQGQVARIIFVHVPSAWLAMMGYAALGAASFTYLVWRHSLADAAARAIAPIAGAFAFLMLATGSIWGRPTWGVWWVWDGRLASALVQLLLILGYMALRGALDDERQSARAGAILALVGLVNLPIIHFSVEWWATLHQGSIFQEEGTTLAPGFLWPLMASAAGFTALFAALALVRTRAAVFRRRAEALQRAQERAA